MKKIFIFILLGIFLIGFVSAAEWDNVLDYEESQDKITIRNALGLPNWLGGSTLIEATLDENGCDANGRFCEATKTIIINGEMELVQEFKTLRLDDGSNRKEDIRWYKFEYLGQIDDYQLQCVDGKQYGNGTFEQICNSVNVGSHEGWIQFYEGDTFNTGTYQVRTSGEIKPGKVYDWQIKFAGEWTTPWATWGNITLGDDAEVLLNSPADNFLTPTSIVAFNCSVNIGGATLKNMSVYTNESGTFEAKNTTLFDIESLGLISYYKFDGATGTNALDSVGVNNGTISGVTRNVTGIINKSFDFESQDPDFVDLNAAVLPTGASDDFTISAWINPESSNGTEASIMNQNSGGAGRLIVNLNGSRHVRVFLGGSSLISSTQVSLATWSYITVTRDGTNVSLWIDSAHIGSMSKGDGIDSTDTEIGRGSTAGNYFDGLIDEVGFWNRTITATEISDIYNSGSASRPGAPTTSTQTWNRTISSTSLWTCQACDSDGDCGFATTNRTVLVDTTAPLIDVEAPNGTLNFNAIGSNETLNVTFTDLGLDTCLFDYNGTNVSIDGCATGVKNSTNFILEDGNLNMTIYANDTLGNENSTFISWDYFVLQNSQTFNTNTIEGSTESFSINYTAAESPTSASLIYNGTTTSADIDTSNFPIVIISDSIIIPNVNTESNASFFWNIVSATSNLNTTSTNQSVAVITLDNCSSFTNVLFNYTMVDETTQDFLNGTAENVSLEVDISIFSSDRSSQIINFSTLFTQTNSNSICSQTSLFNTSNFILDSVAKYSSSGRSIEYYNIRGFEIDNTTVTQNITLFDVKTSEATDFQITFKNSDFVVVENALIQVNRQYVQEGVFKTVEIPITDSNGQTVVHLIRNDIVYNYIVTKGGVILGTFNNLIAFCEDETIGQCFIPLNALQGTEDTFNADQDIGISLSFTFNETTRDLVLTFSTNDGSVKTVLFGAIKMDQLGNTSVCNTSITSASGTLTCNVPVSLGNETIITSVFVDNELKFTDYFSAASDIILGEGGYFLLLFLVLSLGLMFSESKSMMVAGIILGFVAGGGLFLIKGGIIGTGSAVMWLIIMGVILIWKLQSEGQT